jgi:hypothetical protein
MPEAELTGSSTISLWMARSTDNCSSEILAAGATAIDQPAGTTEITAASPHTRWHIPSGTATASTSHRACIYDTGRLPGV